MCSLLPTDANNPYMHVSIVEDLVPESVHWRIALQPYHIGYEVQQNPQPSHVVLLLSLFSIDLFFCLVFKGAERVCEAAEYILCSYGAVVSVCKLSNASDHLLILYAEIRNSTPRSSKTGSSTIWLLFEGTVNSSESQGQ